MNTHTALKLFIVLSMISIFNSHAISIPFIGKYLTKKVEPAPIQHQIGVIKLTTAINNDETEKVLKKIIEFADKASVKGILLMINSGGGNSGLAELISREIETINKTKPVVALVTNMCNSGAYLVAASASSIVAPSMGTIGGIGVLWTNIKLQNIKQKNTNGLNGDIVYDTVHAGKYKLARNEDTPIMNDDVRAFYQEHVDNCYKNFIARVALFRKLNTEKAPEWADAKEFSGEQALHVGLIDQIGGYSDAVEKLKTLMRDRGIYKEGKLQFIE